MKTIIKLLITAVFLNALYRTGVEAMRYYEFKDAAYQIALFGGFDSEGTLHTRVVQRAADLKVPIAPEQITVRRADGQRVTIAAEYDQPVELFPRFTRSAKLSFNVEAYATRAATPSDITK